MQLPQDPILRELLPEFLSSWQIDAARIVEAAQSHNDAELYRLGHTLKGTCLQFGLTELAELGVQLMECARAHRWDEVPVLYERMLSEFQQLQQLLGDLRE
ncbi:MAG: Hpt domain-containing protein [Candidatus Kapabacteria bacterium]|nr:Hpt domain-containing protein [Candidatus Kapabacteria bacterium]MDW7997567.1 Hpt domain-containing protein [Bacteroidota bacterium]